MAVPEHLDVTDVQVLCSADFEGARLDVQGRDLTATDLLLGHYFPDQLVVKIGQQGEFRDLVGTYWANVYLMSARLRWYLTDQRITGWTSRRLIIDGAPTLWLLSIVGRCGPLLGYDPSQPSPRAHLGTFVDPRFWDGSDMFLADGYDATFVRGEVADRLREAGMTNVDFEPAGLAARSVDDGPALGTPPPPSPERPPAAVQRRRRLLRRDR